MVAATATPQTEHSAPRLFEPREVSLEESILRVWGDLDINARADCPVCGGTLIPEGCLDCGSVLD